jgi:hypothetical protein
VIRRSRPDIVRPFKMPLYPLPVLVALAGWLFIFFSSGLPYILAGMGVTIAGVLAYLWRANRAREWPFKAV